MEVTVAAKVKAMAGSGVSMVAWPTVAWPTVAGAKGAVRAHRLRRL